MITSSISDPARVRPPLRGGLRLDRKLYAIAVFAFVSVGATGFAWAIISDILGLDLKRLARLLSQVHAASAFMAMGLVGALVAHHARIGWRAGRNRVSGCFTVTAALGLGITGWGLLYAGNALHFAMVWTHIGLGFTALGLVPLHVWLGRRATQPQDPAAPTSE